jgi:hypothetical protein
VHEPDRDTIRTFWLKEVKDLRDRHDRDRLDRNLKPITNKEVAQKTEIPTTTLSDWMSCRRDVVPDWERFSQIVECLDGTVKEWVPKWRKARAAYDRIGKETPKPEPQKRKLWKIAIPAGVVIVAGVGTWVVISAFSNSGPTDSVRPATDVGGARCVKVREDTDTVSVFKDPVSRDKKWGEWRGGTRFWSAGDTTNPPRYRVPLSNGQYGYVTRDSKYVTQADDCP